MAYEPLIEQIPRGRHNHRTSHEPIHLQHNDLAAIPDGQVPVKQGGVWTPGGPFQREIVVDARDVGIVGDGVADDSAALVAVQASLQDTDATLLIPPEMTVRVASSVDLRRIRRIVCHGLLVSDVSDGPGFILGALSSQAEPVDIYVRRASHNGTPSRIAPTLRIAGLKNANITVGRCDWVQLYADGSTANIDSIAYSDFRFGRINTLELWSENGAGWINENTFLGGHIMTAIVVDGSYPHNGNVWLHTKLEGSATLINVEHGHSNQFRHIRAEGGSQASFGANTHNNLIACNWRSLARVRLTPVQVVSDSGEHNLVDWEKPNATTAAAAVRDGQTAPDMLGVPGVAITGTGVRAEGADRLLYMPFMLTAPVTTIERVELEVTTASTTGGKARVGIYEADSRWQPGKRWAQSPSEVAIDTTGVKAFTSLGWRLGSGRYLAVLHPSLAASYRFVAGGHELVGHVAGFASSLMFRRNMRRLSVPYGPLPDPGTPWNSISALDTPGLDYYLLFGWTV